jgi:acyl phosphate:glycerol-3-phosphate acyltransferase
MNPASKALLVVAAYLLGAVPFGLVLTRLFAGKDVRTVGSGNIGASNVARAAGKKMGVLTLVLDAAKASVPMIVTRSLLAGEGAATAELWMVLVGLAAFLGHLYPIWLGFKGGKGVATALGVFVVLAPIPSVLALVTFAAAYGATRVPAVGSLSGTAVCCLGAIVQTLLEKGRVGAAFASPVPWAAVFVTAFIALRHRSNIARLLQGAENKV